MKSEQRSGRGHRLGQEHDVQIYNLAIQNTIEDHILDLLYVKIGVFEQVVGELDDILSTLKAFKFCQRLKLPLFRLMKTINIRLLSLRLF